MSFQPAELIRPEDKPRFVRVADIDAFMAPNLDKPDAPHGYERFTSEARQIIDRVDPEICGILGEFNLVADNKAPAELSENVIKKLDGAPQELLMSLVKYIDFSDTSDSLQEQKLKKLAGLVAQRFVAISLVAHGKKLNNEDTSFHPIRHEEVLTKNAARIARGGSDLELCRKIFGDFMTAGCHIQDAYIKDTADQTGPIATKLAQVGVPPIFK